MFNDLIKKAEDHFSEVKPLALYRKPLEQRVNGIFQNDDSLIFVDDFTQTGFVFAPFNAKKNIVLLRVDEKLESDFNHELVAENLTDLEREVNASEKQFHINLVKKGIKQIQKGAFKKVVLSRRLEVSTKKTPFELFTALLLNYPSGFCYLWYHPRVGLWLGATPEILLKTANKQINTMSLAGTQKYKGIDNPIWGNKELEEQELVTHYIANKLQEEVEQLKISETQSVRAGNLWHLRTSVSGRMKSNTISNCINALHPTPAVCGLPQEATKEFILENENYDREYYTGFLGELNFKEETIRSGNHRNTENQVYKSIKNTTSLYVNLRCMQLKNTNALLYIGGGITKDSIPEKEWEETVAKSETMLKVLAN